MWHCLIKLCQINCSNYHSQYNIILYHATWYLYTNLQILNILLIEQYLPLVNKLFCIFEIFTCFSLYLVSQLPISLQLISIRSIVPHIDVFERLFVYTNQALISK